MNRLISFIIVFLGCATQASAQYISADSLNRLYPRGTWGIEYRNRSGFGMDREMSGSKSFHYVVGNGLAVLYFFCNRWAANVSGMYTRLIGYSALANNNYLGADMSVRYHVKDFYFGAMIDYKDQPTSENKAAPHPADLLGVYGDYSPYAYFYGLSDSWGSFAIKPSQKTLEKYFFCGTAKHGQCGLCV